MPYELRDGGGTIFRNKFHKGGEDKAPHWRGELMWRGEKVEIALWEKKASNGQTFFSLKVQEPREKPEEAPAPRVPPVPGRRTDMDDDQIPFAPEFR